MITVDNGIIERIKNESFMYSLVRDSKEYFYQQKQNQVIRTIHRMMIRTDQRFLNMELKDIESILNITGSGLIGWADVSGDNKAQHAIEQATKIAESQKAGITKPTQALLGIIKGNEVEFEEEEFYTITNYLQALLGEDAEILYGYGEDQQLTKKIRVFVVIPFEDSVV